jgi:hypothetical protein
VPDYAAGSGNNRDRKIGSDNQNFARIYHAALPAIVRSVPGSTGLMLRRREAPSRSMAATHELAAILRDARKGALLRMRSEIYFTTAFAGTTWGVIRHGINAHEIMISDEY